MCLSATSPHCNVIERAVIFVRGGALEFDVPGTGSSVELTSFGLRDVEQAEPEYLTEMRRRERENLCCPAEGQLENQRC